jgi:uncharacterized protein involved in exopolysaccharide biosynthesis
MEKVANIETIGLDPAAHTQAMADRMRMPVGSIARPDETIDVIAALYALYEERRLVLAILLLATLVSVAIAWTTKPVYRAEVLIAPVVQNQDDKLSLLLNQLGGLGALFDSQTGGSRDDVAESMATLRSRALIMEFIGEHNLKPLLFPTDWDEQSEQWRNPKMIPTDLRAYEQFRQQVNVNVDRRTGLVSLAIESGNPVLAARWANDLVRKVNERRRAQVIREARRSIEHLQRQAMQTSAVEIVQVIYRLIEAQTRTIMLASVREDYSFRVIDPAVAPEQRIRPRRTAMVIVGVALGLLIAVVAVAIRRTIRSVRLSRRLEGLALRPYL